MDGIGSLMTSIAPIAYSKPDLHWDFGLVYSPKRLSPRHLHKLVSKMLGIGIKEYSKIIRLKKSLLDIKDDQSNYSNYYDQSHFIRELKQYTGLTPQKMDLKNNDRFIQYYYFE